MPCFSQITQSNISFDFLSWRWEKEKVNIQQLPGLGLSDKKSISTPALKRYRFNPRNPLPYTKYPSPCNQNMKLQHFNRSQFFPNKISILLYSNEGWKKIDWFFFIQCLRLFYSSFFGEVSEAESSVYIIDISFAK